MKEQWTNYEQITLTMTQSEVHSPGETQEAATGACFVIL